MISVLALLAAASTADARPTRVEPPKQVPQELRTFVEPGTRAILVSSADLDRDGDSDYLLVLDKEGERSLLLVVRDVDGSLRTAKRSDLVVKCWECGGMLGDPFVGIEAGPGTFVVRHEGGSRELWTAAYRFDYSRRDQTWQLVEVRSTVHDRIDPNVADESYVQRPPKDFGKIDLADFDPDDYEGKGER